MYNYHNERDWLFTEKGSRCVAKAQEHAGELLKKSGAFMAFSALRDVPYDDTWKALAILDRLVELGFIKEVTPRDCRGQDRVFVSAK